MAESPDPEQTPEPASPRRPRFSLQRIRLTNWQIILIALVVVGGRLAIDFSQRIIEGQQKVEQQQALEDQLQTLRDTEKTLESELQYYQSSAYVEAWAHDQGKMVRDGEKLVVPLYQRPGAASADSGDTGSTGDTAAAATPTPSTPEQIPAWRVWWTLFFDSPPPFSTASTP